MSLRYSLCNLLLILFFSVSAWAQAQVPLEAFVSTEKAFIWRKPGYSWSDCRPLEPDAPSSRFKSAEDEQLTMRRFNSGGREVCLSRDQKKDLLSSGDPVEIVTDKKGKVITEDHEIIIGGDLMEKKFYFVQAQGREGWMSEDQLTEPAPKEFPREDVKKDDPYCPPKSKSANQFKGLALQIPELQNAIDEKIALAPPKSDREIDRYMCLYHDGRIKPEQFQDTYKKFQKSAKQASSAFGVPYGLIMCTMLVESGLYYNPQERKEYKGLSQFGSAFVTDLNKIKTRAPYEDMWEKFQKVAPGAGLSDREIRSSSDPTSPAAAIALAYQWIYWDRMQQVGCKDCNISPQINRKELYMMVTAYNWGPYSLHKVARRSPMQMRSTPPPPRESRNYMARMENCLERGYDQSFREEGGKKSRSRKPGSTQNLTGEKAIYEDRVDRCDRLFPVK